MITLLRHITTSTNSKKTHREYKTSNMIIVSDLTNEINIIGINHTLVDLSSVCVIIISLVKCRSK